jgi:hypothetical protein
LSFEGTIMQSFAKGIGGGLLALIALVRMLAQIWPLLHRFLCDAIRALARLCRKPSRGDCCLDLPSVVHKRADPLIYDQYWLMSQGLSVTWDNPDIDILSNGAVVNPWELKTGTEYQVRVRVWNGSYDAPAIGLPVALSFLSFGVGTQRTMIGVALTDLGAKGTSQCPAFAGFTWRTPDAEGHYCLQAFLDWPDDANPDNNLGQKNTQVGKAASPAHFQFDAHNDAAVRRRFHFEADPYALPKLPACEDRPQPSPEPRDGPTPRKGPSRLRESRARWDAARASQGQGKFPIGDKWRVTIEPNDIVIPAGDTVPINVAIEPLDPAFAGRQAVNIHGFAIGDGGRRLPVGGVSLLVERG